MVFNNFYHYTQRGWTVVVLTDSPNENGGNLQKIMEVKGYRSLRSF